MDLTVDDILGLEFGSEHDAYKFYFAYGKFHGFGIRKDDIGHDANGKIVMRQFLCNKGGLRDKKHLMRDDRKKGHRPLSRTNCKAKLRVRLDPNTSKWKVVSFEEGHNHEMCHSNYVPFIRTYRGLSSSDKGQVNCLHEHGVRACHIMGYMMDQKGGHLGIGFNKKDLFNHIERYRHSKIQDGDVLAALSYLQGKADNDPMFYAKYMLGDNGKMEHLFWADGTSRCDYQCFGDVVAFDSTYKKNKYNKPLVIFSGKNHHGQTVIFGASLISDETTDTYKWVLEAFLEAMSLQQPKGVVTDGDGAMREAIRQVFPMATHRLCAWHLQKNACQNVKNCKFLADFKKAMYGKFTPEKFETFWKEMVSKNQLEGNNWILQTYEKRCMWANAYLRDKFFAGIKTTSLCEGVNNCIKTYVRRKNSMVELLHNLEQSLRDYRYNELIADFNSFYTEPVLTTSLQKIEKQAAKLYTQHVFKLVKAEILDAGAMNVVERTENGNKVVFKVEKYSEQHRIHEVVFDTEECKFFCDCMLFESCGIPCGHIICSMRLDHITLFPTTLICKRWMKDAKSSIISSYDAGNNDSEMSNVARLSVLASSCNRLCEMAAKKHETFNFIREEILKLLGKIEKKSVIGLDNETCDPNVVKTKGAPQKKKLTKKRKCSNCHKCGHIKSKCPLLDCIEDNLISIDEWFDSGDDGVQDNVQEDIRRNEFDMNDSTDAEQSSQNYIRRRQIRVGGGDKGQQQRS
ncbi:protein FAR1-RELATED SEQUENCE 5 [Cajanus cajan]|uniref:protein FAR1-RELATED SEQUENCE 5 n=1 Tax=Cajanus cajan TaxID=3821 RepID=UPI00098D95CA|nr:protein FAR1-RELATED SEQUENCE 5 [Cajanus cajan]